MKSKILNAEKDPHILEVLYRSDPEEFIKAFQEAYIEKPDSGLLQFWQERLFYTEDTNPEIASKNPITEKPYKSFLLVLFFCIIAGLIVKLPFFIKSIKDDFYFYIKNISFFFLPFIAFYYLIKRRVNLRRWIPILILILCSAVYINLLSNHLYVGKLLKPSDAVILALIHMPFILWFAGGLAFLTPDYANLQKRIDFLKINGEIVIDTFLILLGGMVLTFITMALFSVSGFNIQEWYVEWIDIIGLVSAPIVATSVVYSKGKKYLNLSSLLSKIFTPLFMITLLIFLFIIGLKLKNPFTDKEFLLVINVLLLIVTAITIFVLIDRPKSQPINFFDYITLTLLVSSFIIEVIAVYAILLRLTANGLTPNRLALIGINLIMLVHISGMIFNYIKWLRKKADIMPIVKWIGNFIPVYFYWSGFMVFIYPWIFKLR
jgi:hypothetical protein